MALKAGYYGIKKFIADKLNRMNPGDSFATDAEIAAAVEGVTDLMEKTVGWVEENILDITNTDIGIAWNGAENPDRARLVIPIEGGESYILDMGGTSSLDALYYAVSEGEIPGAGSLRDPIFPQVINTSENDNYIVIAFSKTAIKLSDVIALNLSLVHASVKEELNNKADITLVSTKADITALGTEEGATASKLYHPGEYFYKDGKTYRVKGSADVQSGSTWTSDNSEEKPLYDAQIKPFAFSGTTNANGNITLSSDNTILILAFEVLSGGVALLYKSGAQHDSWSAHIVDPSTLEKMGETAINGVYYYIKK